MSNTNPLEPAKTSKKIHIKIGRPISLQHEQIPHEKPPLRSRIPKKTAPRRPPPPISTNNITPAKPIEPHQPAVNRERIIITKKLQEIDDLRTKIIQLQWALSSHEDLCAFPLEKKKSTCFPCMKFNNRSKVSTDPNDSKTLDQMSTEVVFNSSRESLPKFQDNLCTRRKKYRKRKKTDRKQGEAEEEITKVSESTPKYVNKGVKSRTHAKLTNNNSIQLPDLFSSNKSSTEEMVNLAEKLDAQHNEIQEIKMSLKECLDILRSKDEEQGMLTKNFIKASMLSKSIMEDRIFLNQVSPSIMHLMKERDSETINFLTPNTAQVFTCKECDSGVDKGRGERNRRCPRSRSRSRSRSRDRGRSRRRRGRSHPKSDDTFGRSDASVTCSERPECNRDSTTSYCCEMKCRASKCCKKKKKKKDGKKCCKKSKCAKSKCAKSKCRKSQCSPCCAAPVQCQPRECQPQLIKYVPACEKCDSISIYDRDTEKKQYKEQTHAPGGNGSQSKREPRTTTASSEDMEDQHARRRFVERNHQEREQHDGGGSTGGGQKQSCCACSPSKGCKPCDGGHGGPCPGKKRKNCFIRCLLCLFCRNL